MRSLCPTLVLCILQQNIIFTPLEGQCVIDACMLEPAVTRSSAAGTTSVASTTPLDTGTSLGYVVAGTTQPTFSPAPSTTAGMPVLKICCQYRLLLGRFSETSQAVMQYF